MDQIRTIVGLVGDVLGPGAIGTYLHGSSVFGGLQPTSDVWALAQLPPEHRPVLEHAKELYLTRRYSEEDWSDELRARVRPHVDRVLAEIDRLSHR
ncbi:aminoglycoside adenylyltransferase domain-containing protein [Allosalinactinospora lopnorensis]|uniref:aminoglycoside adenylyltransferase domain-containing protein n=1 Tax=Allosalinactinospora lopnorensis TaxID=1352348 RepID=UPI000623F221|nr:aminoglycoside adenylyltransferase domain-containing protein [Allosalinactinospora lopnorensis]